LENYFLGLTYLLYQKRFINYKIFDHLKDLPLEDYPKKVLEALESKETTSFIDSEKKKADQNHIRIVSYFDEEYPLFCKHIKAMPPVLYLQGNKDILDQNIAIVGSRKASAYGMKETILITKHLVKSRFVIVSGLAYGIDAIAHKTCLLNQGTTFAVMGCGADINYPAQHKNLKKEIADNGLIISEFPLGTPPIAYHFPVRNRIISALSKCTIVIEATSKSGSLITADYALDQGKDVLAVPGNIDSETSKGTNQLIKAGAVMINDLEALDDYLKASLGMLFTTKKENTFLGSTPLEIELVSQIKNKTLTSAELIGLLPFAASEILQNLSSLELMGLIKENQGYWLWIS